MDAAILLLTSTGECCLLLFYISPSPIGNGLSAGVSSFNPILLCGSWWDKARVSLACIIKGGWLVLLGGKGGCDDVPLFVVCNAGALLSSFPCSSDGPLEGLRILCGVTEALSYLRNMQFRKVIFPDLSTLIRYWLWGRVLTTWPVVFHRPLFMCCIDTICPFKSRHSVWAVQLYCFMSRLFSWFRAAAIHSACGLYNLGWDGTKSRSQRWSNNWAEDKPIFWMGVFRYCYPIVVQGPLSSHVANYYPLGRFDCQFHPSIWLGVGGRWQSVLSSPVFQELCEHRWCEGVCTIAA